ncbi:MAG: hypothetical protein ACYCPP_05590 [Nitrososphaerales archaeon]
MKFSDEARDILRIRVGYRTEVAYVMPRQSSNMSSRNWETPRKKQKLQGDWVFPQTLVSNRFARKLTAGSGRMQKCCG